jgi:hypothetical protein
LANSRLAVEYFDATHNQLNRHREGENWIGGALGFKASARRLSAPPLGMFQFGIHDGKLEGAGPC